MDDFYSEEGIFIHSEVLDTKCMIDCLQSLSAICPGIKITSVICDEVNAGYKVYFEEIAVQDVLIKRLLKVAGREVSVYPITTCLVIHDVHDRENIDTERELTSAIKEKYGKVLHSGAVSAEKSVNKFLVQIDIPEMKDLSVFKRNGYPKMYVRIPNVYKKFLVQFCCARCKKYGHTYQECLEWPPRPDTSQIENKVLVENCSQNPLSRIHTSNNDTNLRASASNFSKSTESAPSHTNALNFDSENMIPLFEGSNTSEIRREDEQRGVLASQNLETSGSQALKDERDATTPILSNSLNPSVERNESENAVLYAAGSPMSDVNFGNGAEQNMSFGQQQKNPLDVYQISSVPVEVKSEIVDDDHEPNVNVDAKSAFPNDENSWAYFPVATSTTEDDDDVQIINFKSSSDYVRTQYEETENDVPESDDTIRDESALPAGGENPYKSAKFSAIPYASHLRGQSASSPQRHHVWDTSVLSDQLKKCISDSCAPAGSSYNGALDKQKLDAFFMHVYKKINPRSVARNFTDADTLKQQLQQIVDSYYIMPMARTKEDSAFIKWLELLIGRYDGKRKFQAEKHT